MPRNKKGDWTGSKNPRWKGGQIKKNCESCKKEFLTWPYMLRNGWGRFCGSLCANRWVNDQFLKEKHWNWQKKPSYTAIHLWLRKEYGPANKCSNKIDCPKKAEVYNWCLKKGKEYERKRQNFIMLCRACHVKYDNMMKKAWVTRKRFDTNSAIE